MKTSCEIAINDLNQTKRELESMINSLKSDKSVTGNSIINYYNNKVIKQINTLMGNLNSLKNTLTTSETKTPSVSNILDTVGTAIQSSFASVIPTLQNIKPTVNSSTKPSENNTIKPQKGIINPTEITTSNQSSNTKNNLYQKDTIFQPNASQIKNQNSSFTEKKLSPPIQKTPKTLSSPIQKETPKTTSGILNTVKKGIGNAFKTIGNVLKTTFNRIFKKK